MPIITVSHASPLTEAQVDSLLDGLTTAYTSVTNADPSAVHVIVQPIPAQQWSIGGQSLARRRKSS